MIRDTPDHQRFAARAGLTTGEMIGRDDEFALLRERWGMASGGAGQMVCLTGEAAIGKSRICQALLQSIAGAPHRRIAFQCSPYLRDTALWPVIGRITADSGILAGDDAAAQLEKLEAYLTRDAAPDRERFALIADLLRLDYEPRYGPITLAPAARRAATFATLVEHLVAISRRDPLLVMFEDLHWADPSTLELVEAVMERMREARVLTIVTRRPDKELPFDGRPHVTEVTLGRLGRSGVAEIVARLGGGKLPAATIEAIIDRTDGVPLFVEELTKAMIESGDMQAPASLHDTLMARLDRRPELKDAAQVATVFGRDFDAALVAQVAGRPRDAVDPALDGLRRAELIFRAPRSAGLFTFKHALVRDVAS